MYFFFSCPTELVEIFFVDTTPFVDEYFTEPPEHKYDWRGIGPQKSYISNLLKVCVDYLNLQMTALCCKIQVGRVLIIQLSEIF